MLVVEEYQQDPVHPQFFRKEDPLDNTTRVVVRVKVTNTGAVDGEDVAQLYIRDRVASITRPVKELKGFEKVSIAAGAHTDIEISLSAAELGFYDGDGQFVLEPGEFDIFVGGSSDTALHTRITISPEQQRNLLGAK